MLASWKKSNDKSRQCIESKDITLPTKVHIIKSMLFSVGMYRCESWTIKKADRWRTDVFELWCWRRLLRIPWTVRRLNQSILKEINPEYFLEGLMLKLKLQYFGHLMQTAHSLEKTLILGKTEGRRWSGQQRMKWLDLIYSMDLTVGYHQLTGHDFEQTPGDGIGQGSLGCCSPWGRKEPETTKQLNWTDNSFFCLHISPPFWTSLPSPYPSYPSRLIQRPCLSFLSHTANSLLLSILHMVT